MFKPNIVSLLMHVIGSFLVFQLLFHMFFIYKCYFNSWFKISLRAYWLELKGAQASVLIGISTSCKLLRTKQSMPHDRKKPKDDTEVRHNAILL